MESMWVERMIYLNFVLVMVRIHIVHQHCHLNDSDITCVGKVIQGWDIGVATMLKGEIASFVIQSKYAYGQGT